MNEKYILFVGQEANFQSRSILIPYKEFISVRLADYEILKKCSNKNVVFNKDYTINNLLVLNILPNGHTEKTEYSSICGILMFYAENSDYCNKEDKIWVNKSKFYLCRGFNHIENYCNLLRKKDIVDSFLCLESRNSRIL